MSFDVKTNTCIDNKNRIDSVQVFILNQLTFLIYIEFSYMAFINIIFIYI